MAEAMSKLIGLFRYHTALLHAEASGACEKVLAKLAEFVVEELSVTVCYASGAVVAVVRARQSDTAVNLREALLQADASTYGLCMDFLFGNQKLGELMTLQEAGVKDGDTVTVLRSQLRCCTVSFDGTARFWRLDATRGRHGAMLTAESCCFGHKASPDSSDAAGAVHFATLAAGGNAILTLSADGQGCLWSVDTGLLFAELEGPACNCSFSFDGSWVVGCSGGSAAVWCGSTGRRLRALPGSHTTACVSPEGRFVLTGSASGVAVLWDSSDGELVATLAGHSHAVRCVAFSPDGSRAVTASDRSAMTWVVPSGKRLAILEGHQKTVHSACYAPDGRVVLTTSADGTVRLWRVTGQNLLCLQADGHIVNSAAFSPDGSKVLVASSNVHLQVFCARFGQCLLTLRGHDDWVRAASFSPDGMLIASASYDGTARVWSATAGDCIQILQGHTGAVVSVDIFKG